MSIKPPPGSDEKVPRRTVGNRIGKEILAKNVRKRQLAFPRQILFPANRPTLKLTESIPLSQFSTPSSIVSSLVSLEWNIFLSGTKEDREREREEKFVSQSIKELILSREVYRRGVYRAARRKVERGRGGSGMENAHNGITGSKDAIGK